MSVESAALLAGLLAIGLAVCVGAVAAVEAWMLTHPPRRGLGHAIARGLPTEPGDVLGAWVRGRGVDEWTLRHGGRDYRVWDIPVGPRETGEGAQEGAVERGGGKPVVIVTHGWGESRYHALLRAAALAPHASRLILWDLPGHGESPGSCALGTTEAGVLTALMRSVREHAGGKARIGLYGSSLGAGVSIVAACEAGDENGEGRQGERGSGPAWVIAEAPYRFAWTPASRVLGARGLPVKVTLGLGMTVLGWALRLRAGWWREVERKPRAGRTDDTRPRFDRAAWAARLGCPLLVIHGERDDVCPMEHGESIGAAARDGEIVRVKDAGHLDLWTNPAFAEQCTRAIAVWLESIGAGRKEDGGAGGGGEGGDGRTEQRRLDNQRGPRICG